MAIRLATVFGGSEEGWLHLQLVYDLALARKRIDIIKLRPVAELPLAEKKLRLL